MGYQDSVTALCVLLGIANPLEEADLKIGRLLFFAEGEKIAAIAANDTNKGSRLFFQHKFSNSQYRVNEAALSDSFKEVAAEYFAEYWDDKVGDHPIIEALKRADTIQILWR